MRFYPAITFSWTSGDDTDRTDRLLAELDGLGVTAVDEHDGKLRAFFRTPADRDAALNALAALPDLTCVSADVPDENWAARGQASIGPVSLGQLTIAPPWAATDDLRAQSEHTIVIQPSMGFGTGHHASTRLCLRWLQALALTNASVLDVGTGSGVLAIAATTLGAARAIGIDVDPDALDSARENVDLNQGNERVTLRELNLSDAVSAFGASFDIILANLTGGLLCRDASAFAHLAAPGARLIVSGFELPEADQIARAFGDAGWQVLGEITEDGWVALLLTIPTPTTTR